MYECYECKAQFEAPDSIEFSDSYDAHGSFAVSHFFIDVCPHCLSEDFGEVEEEEELEDE
jgi:hypothetical protein